jgi:dCMP deaminase
MEKWDKRFINLAKEYSSWSKDPSSKIGAVAIDPLTRRVLSGGYNGFPRGIEDSYERLNVREVKISLVVHAEMNAIYNATRAGISLEGSHLYVWGLPICSDCAKGIIQVGIEKVILTKESVDKNSKWVESWYRAKSMFAESGVEIKIIKD